MPLPTREGRAPSAALNKLVPVQHRAIVVFLGLVLVLGVLYSLITPLFEASDELWHYPFVKRLADGQGLPVQYPDQIGPWRQEGSQPPLYYALGGLLTSWIDTERHAPASLDQSSRRYRDPHRRPQREHGRASFPAPAGRSLGPGAARPWPCTWCAGCRCSWAWSRVLMGYSADAGDLPPTITG